MICLLLVALFEFKPSIPIVVLLCNCVMWFLLDLVWMQCHVACSFCVPHPIMFFSHQKSMAQASYSLSQFICEHFMFVLTCFNLVIQFCLLPFLLFKMVHLYLNCLNWFSMHSPGVIASDFVPQLSWVEGIHYSEWNFPRAMTTSF